MNYLAVKLVHQSAVTLSIAGIFLRGAGSLAGAKWVQGRAAKTLPHVIDSVLLLSALAMVGMLHLTPERAPWLMAKIVGLGAYIGLGVVALRPTRAWPMRAGAWIAALGVVAWIASVAVTKSPAGFFGGLVSSGP
jgi:uncharacterized membrane protein SirB2